MSNKPSAYKKSKLAIGVAAILAASSYSANAANWKFGDVEVNLDSNFTLATSIRMEDRDFSLIGNSNQLQFDWTGYNAATNPIYSSADVWSLSGGQGSYSTNGDLGNLNFDRGEAFSTQFIGLHELDVTYGDFGVFARGFYFYDFELMDNNRAWENPITGNTYDPCRDSEAKRQLCAGFQMRDLFAYWNGYAGDMPVSLRVGDQVVSWGESTFIQHGINTTNPVDVTRARTPGAELREVFLPVGMIFGSIGITDSVSLSAYYQYEFERSRLPVAGSYFATNDFAGEGGSYNNIQLGFSGNPDIDSDVLISQLNALGQGLRNQLITPEQASQIYLAYPTKVAVRAPGDGAHNEADDQGQFGVKLGWFAEELNETEFGFYFINYHSQRPLVSGVTSDFTAVASDLNTLATTGVSRETLTDLAAFTEARFEYPEDIKLYGVSFNTNIGETALAGEFSYRVDEPLQIDDVELLYMGMPEQLANAGLRPDLAGISQLNNIGRAVGFGETAQGFVLSDTWQAQMTVSHVFGPMLGTDNFILLGEAGFVSVEDFPDPSVVRLNAPGTARTPSLEPVPGSNPPNFREGLHVGLSDGPETNPFATDTAWGYRLLAVADFNNIYAGWNLRTRATFSHDVDGTTPDPLFLFTEDVKSANITFTFDYLSKWSISASYSSFWGGIGTTNALADRDFAAFTIKYAI